MTTDQPDAPDPAAGEPAAEELTDLQERAADTEDYIGVPVSDEELGKTWESDSPA